ncbi:armadillo-type protein, partial [Gorgonomyces haynaldii]
MHTSEFEFICQQLQSSDNQKRKEAEKILKELEKVEHLDMLFGFLVNSQTPFYSILLIKNTLTRAIQMPDRTRWIQQLASLQMDYPNFVLTSILNTIAILVKMEYLKTPMLQVVDFVSQRSLRAGLLLMNQIINEFSIQKASVIGLPMTFHQQVAIKFENEHLLLFFKSLIQMMQTDDESMLLTAINCCDAIFSWNPKGFILSPEWQQCILDPQLLQLFFKLAQRFFDSKCRILPCLVQLSGVSGPFFGDQEKMQYLTVFLSGYKAYLDRMSIKIVEDEDVGDQIFQLSQMAQQLLSKFPISLLVRHPDFAECMQCFGNMTLYCLRGDPEDLADTWVVESGEDLLNVFNVLIEKMDYPTLEEPIADPYMHQLFARLVPMASSIVNTFIKTKIQAAQSAEDDDEEEAEEGLKDYELYEDQLVAISVLARISPRELLIYMAGVIKEKAQLIAQYLSVNGPVVILQEELHWILMIAGHMIADTHEGETPQIPKSLVGVDAVVELTNAIFQALEQLCFPVGSVQLERSSPLLVETLFWFIDRWSSTYLFLDPQDYPRLSPAIGHAFTKQGQAQFALDFVLQKMLLQLKAWTTEQAVVGQITSLLSTLSKNKYARTALVASETYKEVASYMLQQLHRLPTSVHSEVMTTIAYIATHGDEQNVIYYFQGLTMVVQNCMSIVDHPAFQQQYQASEMRDKIISTMEMFDGLAMAMDDVSSLIIFNLFQSNFQKLVQLMNVYHAYTDVQIYILILMRDLVQHVSMDQLNAEQKQHLYHAIYSITLGYAQHQTGRKFDEDMHEDLTILFQLLNALLSAAYEGFPQHEIETMQQQEQHMEVNVPSIIFLCLGRLIPLMNDSMLLYPQLGMDYLRLVQSAVEYCPRDLVKLPDPMINALCSSLLFGVGQSAEVGEASLVALQQLAYHHFLKPQQNLVSRMEQCFQSLMQSILYKPFETSLIPQAGLTILCICLGHLPAMEQLKQAAHGQELVQEMLTFGPKIKNGMSLGDRSLAPYQAMFLQTVQASRTSVIP